MRKALDDETKKKSIAIPVMMMDQPRNKMRQDHALPDCEEG
jgi:hypothetical protein